MNLMKSFGAVLGILVVSLFLFQGCTSPTSSSSSGFLRVQVIPAVSSLQPSTADTPSSTFITVIVRDSNGNLVPAGIPVTITCGAGYLGEVNSTDLLSSITINTDSNGMVQVRYTAGLATGTATISAISQGNSGSATIKITSL